MQRRSFVRLAGGGVVMAATLASGALAGCTAAALPAQAIEAWSGPPEPLTGGDVRRWLLSYAILAPHSHNLQSWLVDLRVPDEITLYCDPTRTLPQTDPLARQIMMSHGTFLELLDLAAKERGLRADIDLFPQGVFATDRVDARPVARIRLVPDAGVAKDPLFAQILRRRTNRSAYDPARAIPAQVWEALAASVDGQQVRVGHVGQDDADTLALHRSIALEAWRIEITTPRTIMESYHVLRVGSDEIARHRDGLSLMAPLPVALAALGLFDRSKPPAADDYATTSQIHDFDAKLQSTPGFWWMVTADNSRPTQVGAGRAYVRAQLAAAALGVSMQPLSQALQEYPEQQTPYAHIHTLVGAMESGSTVQMWARMGYAPPMEPSPRRKLDDFIRPT